MNLSQFQIILKKINALDKNISMDGKISSIEKDLMKAYVSQLYEACVNDESAADTTSPAIEVNPPAPTAKIEATPVEQPPVHTAPAPVQNTPPPAPPVQQPSADTTNVPPTPVEQVVQQPAIPAVQNTVPVETPPAVVNTPIENPAEQTQNKLKDLNDRIAANTKTVADKLANPQAKSLNDRLKDQHSGKTFNDRFTKEETSNTNVSAPKMVKIPDSLKHLDNSNTSAPVAQPTATVTPPPPPVEPTPVAKVTPPPAPTPTPTPVPSYQPVQNRTVNINEIYALFDDQNADEAAGKWGSTPIQDIGKSIGLNDKISMIKELFNDDHQAFNNTLSQLNNLGSFNEAKDYMMRNLVTVFKWNEGSKIERAKQLINLVRRRYK